MYRIFSTKQAFSGLQFYNNAKKFVNFCMIHLTSFSMRSIQERTIFWSFSAPAFMEEEICNPSVACGAHYIRRTNKRLYKRLGANKSPVGKYSILNSENINWNITKFQNYRNARAVDLSPHLIVLYGSDCEMCVSHHEDFLWISSIPQISLQCQFGIVEKKQELGFCVKGRRSERLNSTFSPRFVSWFLLRFHLTIVAFTEQTFPWPPVLLNCLPLPCKGTYFNLSILVVLHLRLYLNSMCDFSKYCRDSRRHCQLGRDLVTLRKPYLNGFVWSWNGTAQPE